MAATMALFAVPFILAFGGYLDAILLCLFTSLRNWMIVEPYLDIGRVIRLGMVGASSFTFLQVIRYFVGLNEKSSSSDGFPAKPMIFPCRTNHARLSPKTHSFSYSYLWVGIPIGWKGSIGGLLSSDLNGLETPWYTRLLSIKSGGAWHTVNGDDYLARGHVDGGLEKKLLNYLHSKDIDPKEYPYAYLLTAPRFLGYVFNPVSIWYLYSAEKEIKAIILEVNNTFDERHIYLVKPELVPSSSPNIDEPPKLINTWPKDFYVSVFNSRAGNYTISATDPLFPSMNSSGAVNITITLKSAHATLVARIYSAGSAIDPSAMTFWGKTKFLASWWWVGLATFPRTVVQALILLFRRKMPWVFRPEPRRDTMPRHADATEILLEKVFRKYLRSMVEKCDRSIMVNYSPAGLVHSEDETMTSSSTQLIKDTEKTETLEFKVLTPAFYSRLLHYTQEPICSFRLEQESGTVAISNIDLLSEVKPASPAGPSSQQTLNPLEHPRLWAIQNLRTAPQPISNDATSAPPSTTIEANAAGIPLEKQTLPAQLSPLESFLLSTCSAAEKSEYASRVLKYFISLQIAFGSMDLLKLEVFLVRSRVAWVVAGWLGNLIVERR